MVDWQVTATTVFCPVVNAEVTFLVYKDFSTRCTGFARYNGGTRRKNGASLCTGPECPQVTRYREKLQAEERE